MSQHGQVINDSTASAVYIFSGECKEFVPLETFLCYDKSVVEELLVAIKPFAEAATQLEFPRILNEGWVNPDQLVVGLNKIIRNGELEKLRKAYVKHSGN